MGAKKIPNGTGSLLTLRALVNPGSSPPSQAAAPALTSQATQSAGVARPPEHQGALVPPTAVAASRADSSVALAAEAATVAVAGYQLYDPDRTYAPGDHVLVPLNLIRENPRNPRVFMVEKKTQELTASVAANGQMEAGLAYPKNAEGYFPLKGGHRRKYVLELLNKEYMKLEIVREGTNPLEEYRQARALNLDHQSHTHIDDAFRFAELLADGLAPDQTALAEALKVDKSVMSKSLSIAEMPSLLLEPMAENIESFGLSSAYAVYRFWSACEKDEEKTLALIQKVIEGRLSVRALESLVKEASAPKNKRAVRREHAVARAGFSGIGNGELKSYAAGRISLELSNLANDARELAYSRIIEVLSELGITTENRLAPTASVENS